MQRTKRETPVWTLGRSESTAIRVEKQIKEALLDGHFAAGDFLGSENDLTVQFGVSRLPIREALGRLEALGVVDIRTGAGGGARIAHGNPERFSEALAIQLKLIGLREKEVFDALLTVETAVVGFAAQAATDEDVARMREALELAESLVDSPKEFLRATMAFRKAVAGASHNHFLDIMMQAVVHVFYRTLVQYTTSAVARSVAGRHRLLFEAICRRDADTAREIVAHNTRLLSSKYLAARDVTRTNGAARKAARTPAAAASKGPAKAKTAKATKNRPAAGAKSTK